MSVEQKIRNNNNINENNDNSNKNDDNNNRNNNNNNQETLGWCPAGDSLISWEEGSSLALVGNPSRDGVLIKILCGGTLNPTLSYYEWIMSSNEIETNDMNGSRLTEQRPSSSRCSPQGNNGCHHVNPVISKRRK